MEIAYADGRIVKDEIIDSPGYWIDGAAGGEIDFVIVKAGTTREPFHCARAPVAACSDGLDNDGDLLIDYPTDPQCTSSEGIDEGLDNGDGFD